MVYGVIDIDKMAGPSEVLVIADARAHPAWVAADLIAQAEHGSGDESAVLITPSRPLANRVVEAIERALDDLPRAAPVAAVLAKRGAVVLVAISRRPSPWPTHRSRASRTRYRQSIRWLQGEGRWRRLPRTDEPGAAWRLPRGSQSCPAHRRFGPLRLSAGCLRFPQRTSIIEASLGAMRRSVRGRSPGADGGFRRSCARDGSASGGMARWEAARRANENRKQKHARVSRSETQDERKTAARCARRATRAG